MISEPATTPTIIVAHEPDVRRPPTPKLTIELAAPTPRPSPRAHQDVFDFNLLSPPLSSSSRSQRRDHIANNLYITTTASPSDEGPPLRPASAPATTISFSSDYNAPLSPPVRRPTSAFGTRTPIPVRANPYTVGGQLLPPPPPLCASLFNLSRMQCLCILSTVCLF
jgi:hypothetical protein